ncbi:MAG: hypothetical protein QM682_13715 [Paracoccus sp. (in: a-proteobacteria)]|uniref:hypothetical protein n=1 Tax=Paracoccus sp. TaxID=267 RepID=UPI0039E2B22E
MRIFSRPNPFFPRTAFGFGLIMLVMPPYDGDPLRYVFAPVFALIPWAIHAADLRYGVGRHGSGGGDSCGGFQGDSGGGGDCGGGGGDCG